MVEVTTGRTRGAASLDGASFEALLLVLNPDRERAGHRYESIRSRLLRFFAWRGARAPEELADATFDRVCRKVTEGLALRSAEAEHYFLGVARNVLREAWDLDRRRPAQELTDQALTRAVPAPEPRGEDSPALACLERCLGTLPPETRDLVLLYYGFEGGAQIPQRRALATRLGIGVNALRIRLHRLRARLEDCVRGCLQRAGGDVLAPSTEDASL